MFSLLQQDYIIKAGENSVSSLCDINWETSEIIFAVIWKKLSVNLNSKKNFAVNLGVSSFARVV